MDSVLVTNQGKLTEILKKKGIGPEGSKSIKAEQVDEIIFLMKQGDVSITTKATFLTALLTLPPTEVESKLIETISRSYKEIIPAELFGFISSEYSSPFFEVVKKVVSNNDLSEEGSTRAMAFFFDAEQPEFLKASLLESERLKRETFLENKIFFEALWNQVEHSPVNTPTLIDLADSYDGCNRTRHFSVFVASLLAAAGFPVYLHGTDFVAPKEAVTSHQILKAAGKNPLKSKESVIKDLLNPSIGWGYIDQQIFFPKLFRLKKMRKEMVKRPFLATFEKLLQPIQAQGGNLIVTGYTHSHYREELVKQLEAQNKCKQALVLKGVEGSTQLSMARKTVVIHFDGNSTSETNLGPEDYALPSYGIPRDMSITAEVSLEEGIRALRGEDGFAKDNIVYTASLIIDKLELVKKQEAIGLLHSLINSGKAFKHWESGCI